MATILNYENYEITIDKKIDSIYVEILDRRYYKSYKHDYLDTDVIQFNMTLDIFYKVILTSFNALVDNNDELAIIKINLSSHNININIHHKFYIEFKFELCLKLNTENSLSTKELCIKKLEQKLDTLQKTHANSYKEHVKSYTELEQKFNKLDKFIDDFMELTITDNFIYDNHSFNESYVIKMNTPIIELYNANGANNNQEYIKYTSEQCRIPLLNNNKIKFNTNFKMIKCHTLTIHHIADRDFNYGNLPLSLTRLIIRGDTAITYFKNMDLPNLETIQFESSNIQYIYSSISHLKSVKNIRITDCKEFKEIDLLLTNEYKLESY
jgi:hypothetical protein